MNVHLIWDDTALTICPCPRALQKILTFRQKELEGKKETIHLFTAVGELQGQPVCMTYQGFWKIVTDECTRLGWTVTLLDKRLPFPNPKLHLMGGFRASQQRLTTDALLKNRSGVIEAPTRYGKAICLANVCRAYPDRRTVIALPGQDLVRQLTRELKLWLPERRIKMIGGGTGTRVPSDDLTVCGSDSLHHCDLTGTDLLLGDEIHTIATDTRIPLFNAFTRARRIGFTATRKGRFDQRDLVPEGLFGPVLSEITYREAVAEGAICPIVVVAIPITFELFYCTYRPLAMRRVLWENPKVAAVTRQLCDEFIPPDWQTLLFIRNEASADYFANALSNCRWPVAMAKLLTTMGRRNLTQEVKDSVHMRVLCSDIYGQGMTFSDLRVLVNLGGGGPYTQALQKPGRLAEIRPDLNKKYGVLVDYFPQPAHFFTRLPADAQAWWGPVKDGENRLAVYQDIGYEIRWARTMRQVRDVMKDLTT